MKIIYNISSMTMLGLCWGPCQDPTDSSIENRALVLKYKFFFWCQRDQTQVDATEIYLYKKVYNYCVKKNAEGNIVNFVIILYRFAVSIPE